MATSELDRKSLVSQPNGKVPPPKINFGDYPVNRDLSQDCIIASTANNIMAAHLELIPATRIGVKYPDGSYKSERHFLDFVVSGQSLWEKVGKPRDMVSIFCYEYTLEETIKAAYRLLLTEKADLPAGRRSLFICSECGDIGCGAITALVVKDGHSIVWKTFGYENDYEENIRLDEYKHIGPYTFDWDEYESALLKAIDDLKRPS